MVVLILLFVISSYCSCFVTQILNKYMFDQYLYLHIDDFLKIIHYICTIVVFYLYVNKEVNFIMDTRKTAWYALRRTLVPWRFEELLDELVNNVEEYSVDEVILKIDTEEFSHGHPPLEMIREMIPRLKVVREKLRGKGVCFSINPWSTLGHADRANSAESVLPGIGLMIGSDGYEAKHCACPLSPVWLNYIKDVWKLYAELEPQVLWLEDDIRNFNHSPIEYGCFCNLHMKKFGDLIGKSISREDLVSLILKEGEPHPYRKAFLALQGDITNEVINEICSVVKTLSPSTAIGLMSSGPDMHVLEGRDWSGLEYASGNQQLISRPPLGNYNETSLRGLYYSLNSIKSTRAMFSEKVVEMTEVESIPFTQYSKSNTFTFLQMAVSFAMGCEGVTLNVFDHRGSFMNEDPGVGEMLTRTKPFLSALKDATQGQGIYRGIQLHFNEDYSKNKYLSGQGDYSEMAAWDEVSSKMLESLGIPTQYGASNISVLTGQMIRSLTHFEISQLLELGVMLDSIAAAVLIERGYGNQIGLSAIGETCSLFKLDACAAESYFNEEFGGARDTYLSTFLPEYGQEPQLRELNLLPGTLVVSRLVDADRNPGLPLFSAFENEKGGRVVVCAYELKHAVGTSFFHSYRRRQIVSLLNWICRDNLAAIVHNAVYPLFICKDMGDLTFCALFNLTLDPYDNALIELSDTREIGRMELLDSEGSWNTFDSSCHKDDKGKHFIELPDGIDHKLPCCIRIHWR